MDKFHFFPSHGKKRILSNIKKCQSLTTSSLTCTKYLQKNMLLRLSGNSYFFKKILVHLRLDMYRCTTLLKKNTAERQLRQSKKYTSPHVWDLNFFSFSTKDLVFFMFEIFPKWENFTKSKNWDLEKNYSSFLSILSKKERIKTITYVFKS